MNMIVLQLGGMKMRCLMTQIEMYPRFGICTYDSSDGPHAICFGNEAKAGYDSGLGEGSHLIRRQLHHLTFGNVASESK